MPTIGHTAFRYVMACLLLTNALTSAYHHGHYSHFRGTSHKSWPNTTTPSSIYEKVQPTLQNQVPEVMLTSFNNPQDAILAQVNNQMQAQANDQMRTQFYNQLNSQAINQTTPEASVQLNAQSQINPQANILLNVQNQMATETNNQVSYSPVNIQATSQLIGQSETQSSPQSINKALPQYNNNQAIPQSNAQTSSQYNAQASPQYNTRASPQYNAQTSPKYNSQINPQYNEQANYQYNGQGNQQYNGQGNQQYNNAGRSEYYDDVDYNQEGPEYEQNYNEDSGYGSNSGDQESSDDDSLSDTYNAKILGALGRGYSGQSRRRNISRRGYNSGAGDGRRRRGYGKPRANYSLDTTTDGSSSYGSNQNYYIADRGSLARYLRDRYSRLLRQPTDNQGYRLRRIGNQYGSSSGTNHILLNKYGGYSTQHTYY